MRWQCKTLLFALLPACCGAGLADGQGAFPGAVNPWAFERPEVYAPAGYNPYGGGAAATAPLGDRPSLQYLPIVGGTLPGPGSQPFQPAPLGLVPGLPYGGFGGPPLNGLNGGGPFGGGFWPGIW